MEYGSDKSTTKAGDTLAEGKRLLSEAGQSLSQDASNVASVAKHKAMDGLKEKAQSASETITTFADAIRKAGDDLAQHDQTTVGRVVKQAADSLASMSRTVSQKSPEDLLQTARDFGRRNPVAFMAGAVLVGVVLGRLARSSASHTSTTHPDYDAGTGYGRRDVADDAGADWASAPAASGRMTRATSVGVV